MRGRTISIYLPDGNPNGLKICEMQDSIVRSFFIPRAILQDAGKLDDIQAPGVYFLFGVSEDLVKPELYIGETENILDRLKQHNSSAEKDFWVNAVCFVSVKGNLNKAHIKFLENYFCEKAAAANKAKLQNSTTPTKSSLTNPERDFALSFFDDSKLLLSTLGYPILDAILKDEKKLLFCKGKEASATGNYSEIGLTVFKGSTALMQESPSADKWVIAMRNNLKESGILKQNGAIYAFAEDHVFDSPSSAAIAILGRRANGWMEWKDKDGKTLDEKYRKTK